MYYCFLSIVIIIYLLDVLAWARIGTPSDIIEGLIFVLIVLLVVSTTWHSRKMSIDWYMLTACSGLLWSIPRVRTGSITGHRVVVFSMSRLLRSDNFRPPQSCYLGLEIYSCKVHARVVSGVALAWVGCLGLRFIKSPCGLGGSCSIRERSYQ